MKALAVMLVSSALLFAQDVDTILLKNSEQKFSIVSQIEDPVEAAAFLNVVRTKDYKHAKDFVAAYPQSWLLSQAYDVLSRSAIDLGKYDEAVADGEFSLRLLPENPSLLILMANLEARTHDLQKAANHASDALGYLDQIERLPNLTQKEWDELRPQLESSAYFARARVEATQGMNDAKPALRKSLDDLNHAAAWNSNDPEVFYLRAMVEAKLEQKTAAASDLAFVSQTGSELAPKAQSVLSILGKQVSVTGLPSRSIDLTLRNQQLPPSSQALTFGYAGPEACRKCHAKEYDAWRKTGMARMLQPYQPANIIGDFTPSATNPDKDTIQVGMADRPYFEIQNDRYYVDFTIGSKWQQGYATKLPDGRLQVLPIEYNLLQHKWINYWKLIDPPNSHRANIAEFPKLSPATNYQQNCAICHTSQLKVAGESVEHASYLQPGIDCEMCHGPSEWHSKQIAKGIATHADPSEPPFDFRAVNNRDGVRVCAQCHRQSAVREIGDGGEMNYSTRGTFVPVTWMRPFDAFSRKAFYKDGRFRETTFIVEAFTRSACYLRGTAQCATCHSPHLGDFETNQTALKYKNNPNEMCLSCHAEYRTRIAGHTRHAAGSEASQCVTCHMPRIMNALMFQARSHQIEIPSADLTERFGQQESPNVCLSCHSEKGVNWAREQLTAWRQ